MHLISYSWSRGAYTINLNRPTPFFLKYLFQDNIIKLRIRIFFLACPVNDVVRNFHIRLKIIGNCSQFFLFFLFYCKNYLNTIMKKFIRWIFCFIYSRTVSFPVVPMKVTFLSFLNHILDKLTNIMSKIFFIVWCKNYRIITTY